MRVLLSRLRLQRRPTGTVVWLAICLCLIASSGLVASERAGAIPPDPTEDGDPINCPRTGFTLQVTIRPTGLPLVGADVLIDASNAKLVSVEIDCEVLVAAIPRLSWSIVARPSGSTVGLSGATTLTPTLRPDRAGSYTVRLIVCSPGCTVTVEGVTRGVPTQTRDVVIVAQSEVVFPAEVEPRLPALTSTSRTDFPDAERNRKCQGGGGVVDPQWVTVNPFQSAAGYEFLEGEVHSSRISTKDNPLNHDSQDHVTIVNPDPPFRRLVSTKAEFPNISLLGVEWERDHLPERFRATPGDRVSIFGYWIFDCGHPPFYTEIHPPVGIAVHRARAVQLPTTFRPGGFPNGFGTNVLVPGIVSDVWFNRNSGEITRNCSDTGLHQPSTTGFSSGACIRGPSSLNRLFRFNVYLPANPQTLLAEVGRTVPPVPLFINVEGSGGPAPQIVERSAGSARWLEVSVDLRGFTGTTYTRRLSAAWAYPAPDNWGLRSWRLALQRLEVSDDGDCCGKGDGDWRFWVNANNARPEWTKLFDCDGCVHGTETFPASARTGAGLGQDLLLFPSQRIWVSTSGFEADTFVDTNTGTVADLLDQTTAAGSHNSPSVCEGDCAEYRLFYTLQRLAAPVAALTSEARALFDAYVVRPGTACRRILNFCVTLPATAAQILWHPSAARIRTTRSSRKVEFPLFERQPQEIFALTDISAPALRRLIDQQRVRRSAAVSRFTTSLRGEFLAIRAKRGRPGEAAFLERFYRQALPPDIFRRAFVVTRG